MSIRGFLIENELQKYDYNALDNIPQNINGLSEEAKQALLAIFQKVSYIDDQGQTYYNALEEALYPEGFVSITNNLAGCFSTNEATTAMLGRSYSTTIVPLAGYSLNGASVTIIMGDTDMTGYYLNGTISIPNVTGDIVITVTAASAISSISAVFTQGQNVITNVDSLDSLRQYLVVTATYADSTTAVISEYALSGTLSIGTSTITVSYGGKTDTFTVTVTDSGYLYYWDFTDSLADRVNGTLATLYNVARTNSGVTFSADTRTGEDTGEGYHQAIRLGEVFGYGKSVEVELENVYVRNTFSSSLISVHDGTPTIVQGTDYYNCFGYHYSTTSSTDRFGITDSIGKHWSYNADTSVGTNTYLNGDHTITFTISASGVMSAYRDGVDLNAVYPVNSTGTKPTVSADKCTHINIGCLTEYEYSQGVSAGGYAPLLNVTVTRVGIRNLGV